MRHVPPESAVEETISEGDRFTFTAARTKLPDLGARDLFRVIRRHIWLIVLTTALAVAATMFGLAMVKDRFKATALLTLDRTQISGLQDQPESAVDTQIEIMSSANIAELVVERLRLDRDFEFAPPAGPAGTLVDRFSGLFSGGAEHRSGSGSTSPVQTGAAVPDRVAAAVRTLQERVAIRRRGMTDVIAVESISTDPGRAAQISNAYADVYLKEQVAAKLRSIDQAVDALTRQIAEGTEAANKLDLQGGPKQSTQDAFARRDALVLQRSLARPDLLIAAAAPVPSLPYFPPRSTLLIAGLLLGLVLGVAGAYAREARERVVNSEPELERVSGVPNIATIPAVRRPGNDLDQPVETPSANDLDAVQRLYLSLELVAGGARKKAVAVTSTSTGQGRTALALSLARAAAFMGRRSVIVDCDVRHPGLHDWLKISNDVGLANVLAETSINLQDDMLKSDPRSRCSVISAGRIAGIAPEGLFQSEKIEQLLRKLRMQFEVVLLDVPPVERFAEALIVLQQADVILVVIDSGQTTAPKIEALFQDLRRMRHAHIFTVLR